MPLIGLAAPNPAPGPGTGLNTGPGTGFNPAPGPGTGLPSAPSGNSTCTGASCSLQNPLKVSSFCDLLKVALDAVLIVGLPVAVLFLVLVGFKFILAQGNPGEIGKAQKALLNTVIGIAIFLGAWTIAKIIATTLALLGVPGLGSCIR